MDNSQVTAALSKCVERVLQIHSGRTRPLTVADLRLYIRDVRMSEIVDWSDRELDAMEKHAAQFGFDTLLDSVVDAPPTNQEVLPGAQMAWINSPSPFAWT